jgi:phenylalanyl-tRNA synthetase beta subunit
LRFRSPDRTLTDEEVDAAIGRITSALEEKLNVGIRGA